MNTDSLYVTLNEESVYFWATICKTVHPMLSDSCLSVQSVCPVCNVGVLWPNGWMDQYETWHAGRPLRLPASTTNIILPTHNRSLLLVRLTLSLESTS